jgi:molybdopterin-guanine dinucleotide biosynthesis protein
MTKKQLIIGIGGAHSSCGKTTLACGLIKLLTEGRVFHLLNPSPSIGAIKFTKESACSSLVDDETALRETGKDTSRLYDSGARKVLWVRSTVESLDDLMPLAMGRLADCDCIIIEGNSAIEFVKPDIVIFIAGRTGEETKPSASRLSARADIIIPTDTAAVSGANICVLAGFPETLNNKGIEVIIRVMEDNARKKEIIALLQNRSESDKMTCAAARKIAEELKVSYAEVGAAADELRIKIKNCELGCF